MSRAFGWTVAQLEDAVVGLIQTGEIQARLDKQNKVGLYSRVCVDRVRGHDWMTRTRLTDPQGEGDRPEGTAIPAHAEVGQRDALGE